MAALRDLRSFEALVHARKVKPRGKRDRDGSSFFESHVCDVLMVSTVKLLYFEITARSIENMAPGLARNEKGFKMLLGIARMNIKIKYLSSS